MRVTWNGYLFFGTLSLAIYLIQVKITVIIIFDVYSIFQGGYF